MIRECAGSEYDVNTPPQRTNDKKKMVRPQNYVLPLHAGVMQRNHRVWLHHDVHWRSGTVGCYSILLRWI